MIQNQQNTDNIFRYTRRMSQLCVIVSYIDFRIINQLSLSFNALKKDYIIEKSKQKKLRPKKVTLDSLKVLLFIIKRIKKRIKNDSFRKIAFDQSLKYKNFAIKLAFKIKKMQKNRELLFFKSFYDWDRERRMNNKLRFYNTKMFNRQIKYIVKKRIHSVFEELYRKSLSNKSASMSITKSENGEEEFDRDAALKMLMNLRKPNSSSNKNPFAKKSPKITKSSRQQQILGLGQSLTNQNNKQSGKVQASIIKNNVRIHEIFNFNL